MERVGRALGTQLINRGGGNEIVVGHDFRAYSERLHAALMRGLVWAGAQVHDIGMALSPMAYFAQFHLGVGAVAMLTASHNPNGWTGVKAGFQPPLTHGPDDVAELRAIVEARAWRAGTGGRVVKRPNVAQAYLDDLCREGPVSRPIKAICATGNGTASAFAPKMLERLGVEVVPLHCRLDHGFPHYNPNPEALEMLEDMALALEKHEADVAFGFDGDGDRCGVVDDTGEEIWSDKLGLMLMRDLAPRFRGAKLVVDVKSTGLFAQDPILAAHEIETEYWKTGHSHMKRRLRETGGLAGFEKSGHFYFGAPLGRGYDCGLAAAAAMCRLLDRNPGKALSDLAGALDRAFTSPTWSPGCADEEKYKVVARVTERLIARGALAGRTLRNVNTVNGVRAHMDNGSWGLVRASSNTPNLVVVAESLESEAELERILDDLKEVLAGEPAVGRFTQGC